MEAAHILRCTKHIAIAGKKMLADSWFVMQMGRSIPLLYVRFAPSKLVLPIHIRCHR